MSITVKEAGKRGGLALLRRRGREHFAEMGKRGQESMREKYPHMAQQWGRLGGRPKKPRLGKLAEEHRSKKGGWDPPGGAAPPP